MIVGTFLLVVTAIVTVIVYRLLVGQYVAIKRLQRAITQYELELANAKESRAASVELAKTEHARNITRQRNEYEQKLIERNESMDRIVNELTRATWDRRDDDQSYIFSIGISARLLNYPPDMQRDLETVANYVSQQLYHEIRTAKFLRPATEIYRRQGDRGDGRAMRFPKVGPIDGPYARGD
jgi:hypothetical protein